MLLNLTIFKIIVEHIFKVVQQYSTFKPTMFLLLDCLVKINLIEGCGHFDV